MFSWLKNLFGKKPEPLVLTNPVKDKDEVKVTERPPAPKPTKPKTEKPKKATKKPKAESVDFESMNKTQLLAEAKARGVKANASLKREEILERLKNAN